MLQHGRPCTDGTRRLSQFKGTRVVARLRRFVIRFVRTPHRPAHDVQRLLDVEALNVGHLASCTGRVALYEDLHRGSRHVDNVRANLLYSLQSLCPCHDCHAPFASRTNDVCDFGHGTVAPYDRPASLRCAAREYLSIHALLDSFRTTHTLPATRAPHVCQSVRTPSMMRIPTSFMKPKIGKKIFFPHSLKAP